MNLNQYPGTAEHQRSLHLIVEYYTGDPRILAIGLFGSLARGNWDEFSDLDLDIVIEDDRQVDIEAELAGLCAYLGEKGDAALLRIADRPPMPAMLCWHRLSNSRSGIIRWRQLTGKLSIHYNCCVAPLIWRPLLRQGKLIEGL